MSSGLYSHTTRAAGTILTASIYNSDHVNHITNANPSMHGGFSDNVGQMQLTTDPGEVGSEVLAASIEGELRRLRFLIKEITGETHWYESPVTNLAAVGGQQPLNIAAAQTLITLRRTENDTTEYEFESIQAGSGAGVKYSRRLVGSGANAIAEIREYISTTEILRKTAVLFTVKTDLLVGTLTSIDADGFIELSEMTAPAAPAADKGRLYLKEDTGTRLFLRNSAGTENKLAFASEIPTVPAAASEAEVEAATEAAKYIAPNMAAFLPGVVKAWWLGTNDTLTAGYNVDSVNTNAGEVTITFTNDMANTNYIAMAFQHDSTAPSISLMVPGGTKTVGAMSFVNPASTFPFHGFALGVLD